MLCRNLLIRLLIATFSLLSPYLSAQQKDTAVVFDSLRRFPGLPYVKETIYDEENFKCEYFDKDTILKKTIIRNYLNSGYYYEIESFPNAIKKTYYDEDGNPSYGRVDSAGKKLFNFTCGRYFDNGLKPHQFKYFPVDTISWSSLDPRRKFTIGLEITYDECKDYYSGLLRDLEINNGDIVADIGASNGYKDAAMSVLCDSVTFYIQDIDRMFLHQKAFDTLINYFTRIRRATQTNKFFLVIGEKKRTFLPDSALTRIIMINTFHELRKPDALVRDMIRKLKPGGKICIEDKFSHQNYTRRVAGCHEKAWTVKDVEDLMRRYGFYLTKMKYPRNSERNVLIFEQDALKHRLLTQRLDSIQPLITVLDKLYDQYYFYHEDPYNEFTLLIKPNLEKLLKSYPELDEYMVNIAEELDSRFGFNGTGGKVAGELAATIFPRSASIQYYLGEKAFYYNQFDNAKKYYKRSLELDSSMTEAKYAIAEIESNDYYKKGHSGQDEEYAPFPEDNFPHWPFYGPSIPPYVAITGGYEGFRYHHFTSGIAINLFNISTDGGSMVGFVFNYKKNFSKMHPYAIETEFGMYSALTLGINYNRNYTSAGLINGWKPFIGISRYNIQFFYGYNFYKSTKDVYQELTHNRFTIRYILPLFKLSRNP